ncbi:MAG TPA: DsbE family thiol:disulfide interchange protein [Methylotenera sp.]|nr:DsbE family thiol:disulfide interchange protein [Methylotenera sp.]HPV44335.1 DsbE family thiol:disulfide interchange protein [Methylotenera sp.]
MKRTIKFLLPLVLFLIAVGFLFKGLFLDPREVPSPLVGKPAPSFQAPVLGEAGKTFNSDDMKGQVWLLNVWASWCAACREEHPVLMAMEKTGQIATYGLDYKDTDAEAQAVLKEHGNPYKVVATDADGKIGIDYGVYGVPETYVIDKTGVIRYKQIGPITEEILLTKIVPLLKELQR